MTIWGIDAATRCTGWCAGTGAERPVTGAFKYDQVGDDLGLLAEFWEKDLNRLMALYGKPAAVIYESPILLPSDRLLPLRKIYGMGFHLEDWGRRNGVLVQEEGAKKIKKRITGQSFATKDEMVAVVRDKLGIKLPEGDARKDAADAFGCWLIGVDHHAKQYQPRWDQALMTGRGLF